MDHGGGMDMSCNMNMVWNYDTTNLCILTSSWRITSPSSLYVSLTLITLAGVLYEFLRLYIRRLDTKLARTSPSASLHAHRRRASLLPTSATSTSSSASSIGHGTANSRRSISLTKRDQSSEDKRWIKPLETSKRIQIWRSTLYATSIAVSFLLMLVGMTFNAYIIGAIVLGAGLGHYLFNRDLSSTNGYLPGGPDDKGLACHM